MIRVLILLTSMAVMGCTSDWTNEVVAALLGGGGIAAAIGVAIARYAATHLWLKSFLERFTSARRAVVLEVQQTYVDRITKARSPDSPGGTELTPVEQQEALDLAVSRLMEMIGLTAIERALKLMGLPTAPEFIRRWLVTWVESTVKELSIQEVAANGAPIARTAAVAVAAVRAASGEFASTETITRQLKKP